LRQGKVVIDLRDPHKIEIDGGLVLTMVASGLLMIPSFGLSPLIAIGVGVVAAYYVADNVRLK
jgi:hypothetical protein